MKELLYKRTFTNANIRVILVSHKKITIFTTIIFSCDCLSFSHSLTFFFSPLAFCYITIIGKSWEKFVNIRHFLNVKFSLGCYVTRHCEIDLQQEGRE